VPLWTKPGSCEEMAAELNKKDEILLIYVTSTPGAPVSGLVMTASGDHGWLILEDPTEAEYQPVRKSKQPDSWNMGGRYTVASEATVRKDKSLESAWTAELVPGDEVLVLELGVNDMDSGHKVRLRARISNDDDLIGWISPQTVHGDQLLCPLDLLSEEVVQVVKENSSPKGKSPRLSFLTGRTASSSSRQSRSRSASGDVLRASTMTARKSFKSGEVLPWVPGGQYRVLEATRLKENVSLTSKDKCRVPAGALVDIDRLDIASPECVPVAYCTIQSSGPENGQRGWVRCASAEGLAIIDSRDQLQFRKVLSRLQAEQVEKERREAEEALARAREAELERQRQEEEERVRQQREQEEEEKKAEEEAKAREEEQAAQPRRLADVSKPCFEGCLAALLPVIEGLRMKAGAAKVASEEEGTTSPSSSSSKRPSGEGGGSRRRRRERERGRAERDSV